MLLDMKLISNTPIHKLRHKTSLWTRWYLYWGEGSLQTHARNQCPLFMLNDGTAARLLSYQLPTQVVKNAH